MIPIVFLGNLPKRIFTAYPKEGKYDLYCDELMLKQSISRTDLFTIINIITDEKTNTENIISDNKMA